MFTFAISSARMTRVVLFTIVALALAYASLNTGKALASDGYDDKTQTCIVPSDPSSSSLRYDECMNDDNDDVTECHHHGRNSDHGNEYHHGSHGNHGNHHGDDDDNNDEHACPPVTPVTPPAVSDAAPALAAPGPAPITASSTPVKIKTITYYCNRDGFVDLGSQYSKIIGLIRISINGISVKPSVGRVKHARSGISVHYNMPHQVRSNIHVTLRVRGSAVKNGKVVPINIVNNNMPRCAQHRAPARHFRAMNNPRRPQPKPQIMTVPAS